LTPEQWDSALRSFPRASLFHSTPWIQLLAETYRYTPHYLALGIRPRTEGGEGKTEDRGQKDGSRNSEPQSCGLSEATYNKPSAVSPPSTVIFNPAASTRPPTSGATALLPLLEINSALTGRRGVSLPFTDSCEPLGQSPDDIRALVAAAIDLAHRRRWKRLELRGGSEAFPDLPPATTFHGHTLDLTPSESVLLQQTDSAVRRAIRKAEQSGVTVEFSSSPEAVETFYRLLAYTRRRHGVPPQPFTFFRNLQQRILAPGQGTIALATLAGQPIASALYLFAGKSVIYKYGASDERHQQVRANNLVMWRAISTFAAQGFTSLDFGRTSLDNPGLRAFKLSWGTRESEEHYLLYDCKTRRWTTTPDRSTGWHTPVFQRLPLRLSRLLGSILYRHIG